LSSTTSRPRRRSKPARKRVDLLNKEQELLGSRYVTRTDVVEACELVARGEVFPLVTELRPLEEAEAVHARVEKGEVIGRAALRIAH